MATISQTIFSNAFSWKKILYFDEKNVLNFGFKGPINNNPALVKIIAWHRIGDKTLSEPMQTLFIDAYMRDWGRLKKKEKNEQPEYVHTYAIV